MNRGEVEKIVQAVLYEGYNLYPYRPSVKSRCRWTFGGLYPQVYSAAVEGTDAWKMQVECLLLPQERQEGAAGEACVLEINLRFLHLLDRTIGVLAHACDELPAEKDPDYEAVETWECEGTRYQSWQEAIERQVKVGPLEIVAAAGRPAGRSFAFPAIHAVEPVRGRDGLIRAVVVRDQQGVEGSAEISAQELEDSVFRVTLRVFNRTPLENAASCSREQASLRSLAACNAVLIASRGSFVSLIDPPETFRAAAAACRNNGVWPVLVGDPGQQDALLAAPIILYDYPQIAPESPGDLFDGTEIDEILTLRIMTLTDEEKVQAGATDDRTRRLLERTEALASGQFAGLHGAVRSMQPATAEADCGDPGLAQTCGDWNPYVQPQNVESIRIDDVELWPGDRVRLRPGPGGDILDLALHGKTATIESIEQDFEDQYHVAVTLDDDPGQDLGRLRQPGHRFFFKPDELSTVDDGGGRR